MLCGPHFNIYFVWCYFLLWCQLHSNAKITCRKTGSGSLTAQYRRCDALALKGEKNTKVVQCVNVFWRLLVGLSWVLGLKTAAVKGCDSVCCQWLKNTGCQIPCFTCICCRSREVFHHAGTCLENNGIRSWGESGGSRDVSAGWTERKPGLDSTMWPLLLSAPFHTEHSSAHFSSPRLLCPVLPLFWPTYFLPVASPSSGHLLGIPLPNI